MSYVGSLLGGTVAGCAGVWFEVVGEGVVSGWVKRRWKGRGMGNGDLDIGMGMGRRGGQRRTFHVFLALLCLFPRIRPGMRGD